MNKIIALIILMIISCVSVATSRFSPTVATHVNWIFAGEVVDENAEHYQYVFQLQRDEQAFHVAVQLFDAESRRMLLHDEEDAILSEVDGYDWQVGRAFLRFNAINASWVFGFNEINHHGFNFKVDMLKPLQSTGTTQMLRSGVMFTVIQTGPLDGHLSLPNQEQAHFVTGNKAWFRQTWSDHKSDDLHPLKGVLCQFEDGSGFYSMNMQKTDALRGAVSGLFNADGVSRSVSQFITAAHSAKDEWFINVASPLMRLVLIDAIHDKTLISGFVSYADQQGFCLVNEALLNPVTDSVVIAKNDHLLEGVKFG